MNLSLGLNVNRDGQLVLRADVDGTIYERVIARDASRIAAFVVLRQQGAEGADVARGVGDARGSATMRASIPMGPAVAAAPAAAEEVHCEIQVGDDTSG